MRVAVNTGNVNETLRDTTTLVVAFSSLNAWGEKAKAFDWISIANDETVSSILVRDLDNTWYNRDPIGPGTDLRNLVSYVRVKSRRYRRTVCLGSSMGAYAAIAIGKLINADQVLAFSPQTLIDTDRLEAYGDDRWSDYFRQLPKYALKDLIALAALDKTSRTKVDIYVAPERDDLDRRQAENVAGLSGVAIHVMDRLSHNLVDTLRAAGLLRPLVAAAIKGDPLPDTEGAMKAFLALRDFDCSFTAYQIQPVATVFQLRARITNTGSHIWNADHPVARSMRFAWSCQRLGDDLVRSGAIPLGDAEVSPGASIEVQITIPLTGAPPGIYHLVLSAEDDSVQYGKLNRAPVRFHFDVGQQSRYLAWDFAETEFGHFALIPGSVADETNWRAISHSDGRTMFFPVAGQKLRCLPGRGDADAIHVRPDDVDTIVMFGPFIELEAARYRAEVLLDGSNGSFGAGRVEATGRRGTLLFASSPFALAHQTRDLTIDFDVPRRAEQSEIRLHAQGCRINVVGLRLERLGSATRSVP